MRAVWARRLNFLPLPFRTPVKQAMQVGVRTSHGRLSGYFMWHTWITFLRNRSQTIATASVWSQCHSGIGLIAHIGALFFTLEKRLPEEHWKANKKLNLELQRGKETCFNIVLSVRSILRSYADPPGWSAGYFCLLLSQIAVMCSLLTNKSPQFSEMIH